MRGHSLSIRELRLDQKWMDSRVLMYRSPQFAIEYFRMYLSRDIHKNWTRGYEGIMRLIWQWVERHYIGSLGWVEALVSPLRDESLAEPLIKLFRRLLG